MPENHLENILKIMRHDDYDEEIMRLLNMYVASRGLAENYYTDSQIDMDEITEDINQFLENLNRSRIVEKN
jgi:hypothetical protein